MILYIHGFNSSSLSGKAQELKRWLEARGRVTQWVCPDLPDRPLSAIELLSDIISQTLVPPKLVGSSLGGFYATWLAEHHHLKAILLNPAVHPQHLLKPLAGTLQNNGYNTSRYLFTQQHLEELETLDQLTLAHPENLFLMQETGDEVLNWQEAADYYHHANQLIFQGGDHGFTRFRDVLELIDRF